MELAKALQTIKAICDDAVANGRFKSIDDVVGVTDAFNTLVQAVNYIAGLQQPPQDATPTQSPVPVAPPTPTPIEEAPTPAAIEEVPPAEETNGDEATASSQNGL